MLTVLDLISCLIYCFHFVTMTSIRHNYYRRFQSLLSSSINERMYRQYKALYSPAITGSLKHGISISKAYLVDLCSPARRASAQGYFNAISSAGFIVGPLLSGYLADLDPTLHLSLFAGACVYTLNFFLALLFLPSSEGLLTRRARKGASNILPRDERTHLATPTGTMCKESSLTTPPKVREAEGLHSTTPSRAEEEAHSITSSRTEEGRDLTTPPRVREGSHLVTPPRAGEESQSTTPSKAREDETQSTTPPRGGASRDSTVRRGPKVCGRCLMLLEQALGVLGGLKSGGISDWHHIKDVIIIQVLAVSSMMTFRYNFPLFMEEHFGLSHTALGRITSYGGVTAAVGSALCGGVSRRWVGFSGHPLPALATLVVAQALVMVSGGVWEVAGCMFLLSLCTSYLRVCMLGLMLERGRGEERGAVLGLTYSLTSLVRMAVPGLVGGVQELGSGACACVAVLLALAALLGVMLVCPLRTISKAKRR